MALTALDAMAQTCTQPPEGVCGYDTPTDNSNPDGFYWTDTHSPMMPLAQDSNWCPAGVCNRYQARISNRKPNWNPGDWTGMDCSGNETGPIVLFLPGGGHGMTNYPSDANLNPDDATATIPPAGMRLLQKKLFDKGARILEIRYKCPMLND
jgi:hypothetical protein